jgi:hypothetical protein
MEIEIAQNAAEKRLPKSAKDGAHTRARTRVLEQYLRIDNSNDPGRFRAPG